MNAIVCFGTITAFLLGFCFICESTLTNITIAPNDTSVVSGGTVKLKCFTADKNYPPTWSYQKVESGEKKDISVVFKQNGLIVARLLNGYAVRHRIVEDRNTGEYSLQITNAEPEDAGIYTCTARGGLADKRSAELSVIEPFPVCACNVTDVVGENDCHREPDFIELSCKFRVYGNLPKITWMDVNRPEKAIIIDTLTTDDTGMASSKMIIRGNRVGLDTTSFRCMVASTEEADDSRCACQTPKINVLKITNLTESKTLTAPEEVECTGWTKLNASGCDWFRRDYDDNDHQKETHVTSKPLLNLYREEMKPGTYTCVANCSIRGEMCIVKLLDVSYQPPGSESVQTTNALVASAVATPVVAMIVAVAILMFFIWKMYKKRCEKEAQRRANGVLNQAEALNHLNRDFPDAKLGGPTKSERTRLLEERAEARMRANAARRRGENNPGFSADTDVAEGVAADKTKHE